MVHSVLRVHITSDFAKSFSKLPASIQRLATKKDKWFRSDAFDKRLDTHKLKGELKGYVAYSVNLKYRVLTLEQSCRLHHMFLGVRRTHGK